MPVRGSGALVGVGGWTPADLASLQCWYMSDTGVTKDGSNKVSQWNDQSGNGSNLTQGTGAEQPLWAASQLNGYPSITFDGSDDDMAVAGMPDWTANSISVWTVGKQVTWSLYSSPWHLQQDPGSYDCAPQQRPSSPQIVQQGAYNSISPTLNTFFLYSGYWTNASATSFQEINDDGPVTGTAIPNAAYQMGQFTIGGVSAWRCNYAFVEIVGFDSKPTSQEETDIKTYFNDKYSLW